MALAQEFVHHKVVIVRRFAGITGHALVVTGGQLGDGGQGDRVVVDTVGRRGGA